MQVNEPGGLTRAVCSVNCLARRESRGPDFYRCSPAANDRRDPVTSAMRNDRGCESKFDRASLTSGYVEFVAIKSDTDVRKLLRSLSRFRAFGRLRLSALRRDRRYRTDGLNQSRTGGLNRSASAARDAAWPLPALSVLGRHDQATKSVRWMTWRQEAKKDVGACDMPRGAGNQAVILGSPNGETLPIFGNPYLNA